jgi:hypothetical protein
MKLIYFFLSFQFTALMAHQASCQNDVKNLPEKITNSSVIVHFVYVPVLGLDSIAKQLCEEIDRDGLLKIVEQLSDTAKLLVYHVILSNNFELRKKSLEVNYGYKGDKIISTIFTFNNLTWQQTANVAFIFDEESVIATIDYWKSRNIVNLPIIRNCSPR